MTLILSMDSTPKIKKRDIIKYYRKKTKPSKKLFFLASIIFAISRVTTNVLPTMVYTHIIDIIVDTELQIDEAFKTAIDFLLILIGINFFNIILNGLHRILMAKFEHRTAREIANECLEYLFHNSYRFFSENYTGTLNSGVEGIKEGYYTVLEEATMICIEI